MSSGLAEVHEFNTYLAYGNMMRNVNNELYGNLMFPTHYKTDEEKKEIINEIKKYNEFLENIRRNHIENVKDLINKGETVGAYKDIQYLIAIKENNFEMLKLLHEYQVSNIRTSSDNDLFACCIAQLGKPEIFEKCKDYFIGEKIENLDITRIAERCADYENFILYYHLIEKYKNYINLNELKESINKKKYIDEYFRKLIENL